MELHKLKLFVLEYTECAGFIIDVFHVDISIERINIQEHICYAGSLFRLRIGRDYEDKFVWEIGILGMHTKNY